MTPSNSLCKERAAINVSTDPRLIKQLLLTQWINNANPLDPSPTATVEDGSVFGMMLSRYMSDSAEDASPSGLLSSSGDFPLGALTTANLRQFRSGSVTQSMYDGLIAAAASKYGIDPALIKGVIQTESGFQADAVSHAGAKGLMQLMDATARGLGVTDSFDPAQNIDGGTRFLSYLMRKYDGNVSSALAAYNAGPGRVDRLGLVNDALVRERLDELPQETQQYIRRVLTAAGEWGLST